MFLGFMVGLGVCRLCGKYIIIIIIILVITFTHGIHSYVPDIKHISKVHSVAAVLYIQFMLHVILFTVHCTSTPALPAVSVQCPIWLLSAAP